MRHSRFLLFIALFPQLFHAIRFSSSFSSIFFCSISDCMFLTVASHHVRPVPFCFISFFYFSVLSVFTFLFFRSAMIYGTSERRANSFLINFCFKHEGKNPLMFLWFQKETKNEIVCIYFVVEFVSFRFILLDSARTHAEMEVWYKRNVLDNLQVKTAQCITKPDSCKCT